MALYDRHLSCSHKVLFFFLSALIFVLVATYWCHTEGLFANHMLNSSIHLLSTTVSSLEFLLFSPFLGLLVASGANFAVGSEIASRAAVGSDSQWPVFSS